jgi:hypothetical protein
MAANYLSLYSLVNLLVNLYSFLFIYLTTASNNTIDGEQPSLKIPTHFYIIIFKQVTSLYLLFYYFYHL